MIDEQAYSFFDKQNKKVPPSSYIISVHEALKLYKSPVHKLIFIVIIKQLVVAEKNKHLLYCNAHESNTCRFFNFYDELCYLLSRDIKKLSSKIEKRRGYEVLD